MRRLGPRAIAVATAGLLCFSIVGVIRTVLVTAHVRDLNAIQARAIADVVTGEIIPKGFSPSRFTSPVYGSAYLKTRAQMNRLILRDLVTSVAIVRPDGLTVFSSRRSDIGKRLMSTDVKDALAGSVVTPGSGMTPAALFQTQTSVRVYEPLRFSPGPRRTAPDAVAILDVPIDSQTTSAAAALRLVSLGLLAALTTLYLLMLKSSWYTMRGLEGRNTKLTWQAELLNEQVREEQRQIVELKELNKLREDFISMTSHELRTPLTTILGAAKTLQKPQFAEDPTIRLELLQATERQADRLSMLVENLLASARINGNAALRFDTFGFGECVSDALASLGAKSESIRVTIPAGLPGITTDRVALTQILVNLLDNAIKFAPGRTCELGVTQPASGSFRFWVRDEGVGMSKDQLKRVFDRFYQVDSSLTRPFGGLGLGLSLVRDLVQSLEGTLEVQSRPGHGSTFVITLPVEHSSAGRTSVPDLQEGLREAG